MDYQLGLSLESKALYTHFFYLCPENVQNCKLAPYFLCFVNELHVKVFQDPRSIKYVDLSYDPYGPAHAFIAKLLRKSPYEGRTRWREQGRKKPSGPARIAYGPHTGIFSIVLQ